MIIGIWTKNWIRGRLRICQLGFLWKTNHLWYVQFPHWTSSTTSTRCCLCYSCCYPKNSQSVLTDLIIARMWSFRAFLYHLTPLFHGWRPIVVIRTIFCIFAFLTFNWPLHNTIYLASIIWFVLAKAFSTLALYLYTFTLEFAVFE